MGEMGATEPTERAALLRSFSAPSPCQQERGAEHWPINLHGPCAEDKAWSFIIGIEDGWFSYDRSGHLQWRSEEHTSELQSLMRISYAVFCLNKKTSHNIPNPPSATTITQSSHESRLTTYTRHRPTIYT